MQGKIQTEIFAPADAEMVHSFGNYSDVVTTMPPTVMGDGSIFSQRCRRRDWIWVKHPMARVYLAGLSLRMAYSQKTPNANRSGDGMGQIAELWARIEVRIPIGFQDEMGFHFGVEFVSSLFEPLSEDKMSLLQP